jgi:hypothetical protein
MGERPEMTCQELRGEDLSPAFRERRHSEEQR